MTRAEKCDFGGAIVGNAKHTWSYLICMHIVTALALALSRRRTQAGVDGAAPFARVKKGVAVSLTLRDQARIYGRVADNTPTIVSTRLHPVSLRSSHALAHAHTERARERKRASARDGHRKY